jgi:hypothetical protein
MTRAEQIATGPYRVEKSNSVWVIMGPDGRWPWHFTSEEAALLRAKDLTIAYARGQQDRWIPVSEERHPERNTMAIYWNPGLD